MNILLCWIGNTDLSAPEKDDPTNLGPIAQALVQGHYDRAVFLDNYRNDRVTAYLAWLDQHHPVAHEVRCFTLESPTNHKEIYAAARTVVADVRQSYTDAELTFHISPGTPAMALVWLLLAPGCGARVIESSREKGVQTVHFPFEISAYFLPDKEIVRLSHGKLAPMDPAFKDILHAGETMTRVVAQAAHVAPRDVTVLIEGESGTGKELFARAIHNKSCRTAEPFVAVNCGAIPADLVESQLFGHTKGAFTGAIADAPGLFRSADKGTLFLDELGELPPAAQVKLLRVLETRTVVPVGGTREVPVDVRIIAATHRNLMAEVADGRFRADLFYRLAVGILRLPALRERGEDVALLLEHALKLASATLAEHGETSHKKFSDEAKKILLAYPWPGNIRELNNTVTRAVLWATKTVITADTVSQCLLIGAQPVTSMLEYPLGNGFNLNQLLDEIAAHYLKRAMSEGHGVKAKAADLLGFDNYQTLNNWLKRCGTGTDSA